MHHVWQIRIKNPYAEVSWDVMRYADSLEFAIGGRFSLAKSSPSHLPLTKRAENQNRPVCEKFKLNLTRTRAGWVC